MLEFCRELQLETGSLGRMSDTVSRPFGAQLRASLCFGGAHDMTPWVLGSGCLVWEFPVFLQ